MVITDIDSAHRSREASGRFEVAPAARRTPPPAPPTNWLHVDLQNARERALAVTSARRILNM